MEEILTHTMKSDRDANANISMHARSCGDDTEASKYAFA
jgi:hypothetical protein